MLREIELQNAWASVMNGTCLPCPITTEGMIIITSDLFQKNYYVSAGKGVNVYPEDRPPADCTKFQLDAATDAYIPNQYLKDVEIGMPGFFSALADELPFRLQRDDIAEKVLKELWEKGPIHDIANKVEAACKELGQQQPRDLNQVFEWLYERPNLAQRGVNQYCFTIEYDGKSYRTGPGSYYQTGVVGCAEHKGLKLKIELGNPKVLESAISEIASVVSCLFPYDKWWKEQFEREVRDGFTAGGKPDIVPDPSVYLVAGSGHTLKDGQVTNEVIHPEGFGHDFEDLYVGNFTFRIYRGKGKVLPIAYALGQLYNEHPMFAGTRDSFVDGLKGLMRAFDTHVAPTNKEPNAELPGRILIYKNGVCYAWDRYFGWATTNRSTRPIALQMVFDCGDFWATAESAMDGNGIDWAGMYQEYTTPGSVVKDPGTYKQIPWDMKRAAELRGAPWWGYVNYTNTEKEYMKLADALHYDKAPDVPTKGGRICIPKVAVIQKGLDFFAVGSCGAHRLGAAKELHTGDIGNLKLIFASMMFAMWAETPDCDGEPWSVSVLYCGITDPTGYENSYMNPQSAEASHGLAPQLRELLAKAGIQFQGGSASTFNPLDGFWTLSEDKVKRTSAPLDSLLGAITISDGMHNYVFDGDEFVEAGNKIDGATSTNGKVTITVARDKLSTFLAHIGDIRCLWDIKSIL